MRMQAKLFAIVLCSLAVFACGGDDDPSTVNGVVYSWEESTVPITVAGVSVRAFGTDISDTSDANGRFTLRNVPTGDVFLTTEAAGHWGVVDYWVVPTGGDISLNVIRDGEIARWETELARSIPATEGAVDILYYGRTGEGPVGGETGTITPSGDEPPFTFDVWTPVDQPIVIADEFNFGELVFPSVDPASATITATVTGAPGETSCIVDETPGTEYPIMAKTLTIVYAFCEPL
jgi:hypothetical protein